MTWKLSEVVFYSRGTMERDLLNVPYLVTAQYMVQEILEY